MIDDHAECPVARVPRLDDSEYERAHRRVSIASFPTVVRIAMSFFCPEKKMDPVMLHSECTRLVRRPSKKNLIACVLKKLGVAKHTSDISNESCLAQTIHTIYRIFGICFSDQNIA